MDVETNADLIKIETEFNRFLFWYHEEKGNLKKHGLVPVAIVIDFEVHNDIFSSMVQPFINCMSFDGLPLIRSRIETFKYRMVV